MEVECYKIKLNPGSLPLVREWSTRLRSEISDVQKLLANEGITIESVFLEENSDGEFLIYYLRAKNIERALQIAQASQHPIDVFHRQVMKQISGKAVALECLLDATDGGSQK